MDCRNRLTDLLLVVVLLLIICCCCQADFAEVPSSVPTVSENENVLFRCRHERPDAFIHWFINGVPSTRYSDVSVGSIRESDGTFVDTLTIPAIPVYNGTEVVCVATFIDGSPPETTPPAMFSSIISVTFEITPSPLTVAVEQEVATFECQHLRSNGITWLVNETRIYSPNVTTYNSNALHSLSIGTLLEYSGTTVQCVATSLDGSPPLPTPPVTLLIQDTPGKVEDANCERNPSSLLTTRWSSLPSLDLNDTDPDIMYSVELYKITCGEDIFMSHEDVFVNSTNNTVDPMEIYKVIITARNNVERARNGNSTDISEEFMTLNKASLFQLTQNSQLNITNEAPVPSYYTMILEPLDGHREQNLMINISVERSGEMVNMSVDGEIPTKTLWNASLLAYGCQSDTVLKGVELSTHEIQNISVNNSPQPGEVRVTGDFIDDSTATGLLIVIGDSEVIYHKASRDGTDKIKETLITGLAGGEYSISVFVVEENGLPFERVATSPKLVAVETMDVVTPPSSSIEYSLQSTSTGVCITCTFLDSSATDCVAVVHQRISQLSSSGLMNIESSQKLTRSGDTASGCIEGVNMEDYQVGVVGGSSIIIDPSSSIEGLAVGIVLGVLVFVLSAVVVVVVSLIVDGKRIELPLPDIEARSPPPPTSDYVNQTENEATVNFYESITVSRAESADEALEPLLSTSSSPPLPTRQGENRVYSDSSSDSAPSSEDTIETELSSPSVSNDDRISVDPGPLYDLPQLPGSTVMPPPTDIQYQSNEQESPPPVPPRTEDSKILVQESSNRSPSAQDNTSTNNQSPSDPMYAEPQMTGRAPVQTPSNEEQVLQSPPPVPPRTEDREVTLLQGSSESAPTQSSPHIAVLIDPPPSSDPTYAKPQPPAVNQPQSKEKQEVSPSGESCDPTYAQPVLSSGVTSPPPVAEPVVYEDVKGFKNSEGQHYAILGDLYTSKRTCTPDDSDLEKTVYSEIQPHSLVPTTAALCIEPGTSFEKNTANTETHTDPPFTVEYIFPTLLFMASKWQALGEALSLNEDRLDEIFTNNETEEACLRVMLEYYMERSDLKHSWEEIREAKRKVEEGDRGTGELEPTSQSSHLDAGLDKCGEMIANEPGDTPLTCSTISHHYPVHYPKPSACEDTTKSTSSLEYPSKDGNGLTQGYQPNKNDKVSLNMEGLMEFQKNRIQDIQGQSSADVHEDKEEINKNESSKGIRPEGPYRTRMDELYPTQFVSLPCVSSLHLNVFPGIQEDHESSQPTDCSESSEDKTDYLTAIAKLLNIGRTPFARERKESEHGLFHLCRIPKPCTNHKQLRVHKTVCTSSDSSQCTFVVTCTDTNTTRHQVCPNAGANVKLAKRNSDTMHLGQKLINIIDITIKRIGIFK